MPEQSFHQFTTNHLYPYDTYEKPKWNPFDKILGNLGLKRFGLDMLAGYCRKFAKNAWELPPFQPVAVPEGKVLIDFHAHTRLSDGEGTFESILQRISRTGVVDGIAFTNHPFTLAKDRRSRLRNPKVIKQSYRAGNVVKDMKEKGQLPDTFMTFPGSCEFAPAGTHDFPRKGVEVIGLGLPVDFIEKSGGLQRLSRMLAEDLVDKIHDEGGLAILPHPFYFVPSGLSRDLWDMVDAVESFNQTCHIFVEPVMLEFANHAKGEIPLLDDVMSIQLIFGYFSWRNRVELSRHPRPEVGSSDAHIEPFVGSGCTMFDEPVRDLEDLRKQLAANNGVPMLNPRWELHHDLDEIIERVYDHWGKKIVNKIREIHNEKRALLPFLKLATGLFHRVKAKNPLYKPAV